MRVNETRLVATLGNPKVSYGKSTAFVNVPTLVWPIPRTGVHITVFPDDQWKSSEMARQADLQRRRLEALERDDEEARALIAGWRAEGRTDEEVEALLVDSPVPFDPTLETPHLDIDHVTFDEWHVSGTSGSVWFTLSGEIANSDSETISRWVRDNAPYFAGLGLTVRP